MQCKNSKFITFVHMKVPVYIGFGSNMGDSIELIEHAYDLVQDRLGEITDRSSFYESEPWGFEADRNFVNSVVQVKTTLSPHEVLNKILDIENELGRVRTEKKGYSSRSIDLDIIDYNGLIINEESLTVPHPFLHVRSFVLVPLREIDSDWKHPESKLSVETLIGNLKEDLPKLLK